MAKPKIIDPEDVLKAIQLWDTITLVQHQYKVKDLLEERKEKATEVKNSADEEIKTIANAQAQK